MCRSISVVTAVSLTMVLAAVVLPVSALLYIHMLRRRRDVALLGVLGFTRRDVFLSYAMHGVLIGVAGVVLGCGMGAVLVLLLCAIRCLRRKASSFVPRLPGRRYSDPLCFCLQRR